MKISVVIPAYNEAKVIADTVEQIKKFLSGRGGDFEIIVVDDKSTDTTVDVVRQMDDVKLLQNAVNKGKGYSVRQGVLAATGEWILFTDADNSTTIDHLEKFFPHMSQYDLIIGSRAAKGAEIVVRQNIVKVILGRLGNMFIRLLAAPGIKDTQCGFKFFSAKLKPLWEKMTIDRFGFDVELIYLARKAGFKILEMPVRWANNFDSTVKWHSYITTLWQVFQIKINELNGKYKSQKI